MYVDYGISGSLCSQATRLPEVDIILLCFYYHYNYTTLQFLIDL